MPDARIIRNAAQNDRCCNTATHVKWIYRMGRHDYIQWINGHGQGWHQASVDIDRHEMLKKYITTRANVSSGGKVKKWGTRKRTRPSELKLKLGWFSIVGNLFMFFGFCGMLAWIIYFILWTQSTLQRALLMLQKKTMNVHTRAKTIGRKCNSMRRNRAISRFTDHNEDEEENASVVWLFWFEKWWNHSKDSSWLAVFSFQWDECLKIIHISKSHTSHSPHTQNHQKSSNDRVLNELRLSFCVSSLSCRFRVSTTSGECED